MRIALCPNGTEQNERRLIALTFNVRDKKGRSQQRQRRAPRYTESPNKKKPWRNSQGKGWSESLCGALLDGGNYLVELSRGLHVLGEHDIDLRVGRHGDHHAAVGVEVHDF
jgi:hypothetical protein